MSKPIVPLFLPREQMEHLSECLTDYRDVGPDGMGWASPELQALRSKVDAALSESAAVPPIDSLHAAIMNIPGSAEGKVPMSAGGEYADGYQVGHCDARHAAAELALAYDAEMERLRAALGWIVDNGPDDAWGLRQKAREALKEQA